MINLFTNHALINYKLYNNILIKHKFTNAYRTSDRVSQYLIKNVIYNHSTEPKEVLFRILLFKTFNKIETWELLSNRIGNISYREFNFKLYDEILSFLLMKGISIYSGAYIMTSGKSRFGYSKKHRNHLKLIEYMIEDGLTEKVINSKSLESLFNLLKEYPTIGNFLAYQYATDINYSELCNFDEMDFVYPGPGALDGIRKCFTDIGEYDESDIIKYVTYRQDFEFDRLGLDFKNLWGRKLQLIDCQNLFCEVDKYARVAHPEINGISGIAGTIVGRFSSNYGASSDIMDKFIHYESNALNPTPGILELSGFISTSIWLLS